MCAWLAIAHRNRPLPHHRPHRLLLPLPRGSRPLPTHRHQRFLPAQHPPSLLTTNTTGKVILLSTKLRVTREAISETQFLRCHKHQPCDWSSIPPTGHHHSYHSLHDLYRRTVRRCTDGQYGNANVNDILTYTGSASVFSTNATVASAYTSSAAAAQASRKAESGDYTIIHSNNLFGTQ